MGQDYRNALAIFADYKTAEGASLQTIDKYLYHLRLFSQHIGEKDLSSVTPADIVSFIAKERKRGLSDATLKARDTALDVFFSWAERVLDEPSPLRNDRGRRLIKPPKVERKEPRRATDNEIDALLLSIPRRDWWDQRDRTIIHLLRDTGIRCTECSNLLVSDIDTTQRRVTIRGAKNNKYRMVPFTRECAQAVSLYLMSRPHCPPEIANALFVGSSNVHGVVSSRLTDSGIRQMIKRRCGQADIRYVNPHSIRHLFGIRALNSGIRAEVVSKMMGHHSVDFTIDYYAPLLHDTIQREYDENW